MGIHVTAIMKLQEILYTHVRTPEEGLTIALPFICPSTTLIINQQDVTPKKTVIFKTEIAWSARFSVLTKGCKCRHVLVQ